MIRPFFLEEILFHTWCVCNTQKKIQLCLGPQNSRQSVVLQALGAHDFPKNNGSGDRHRSFPGGINMCQMVV